MTNRPARVALIARRHALFTQKALRPPQQPLQPKNEGASEADRKSGSAKCARRVPPTKQDEQSRADREHRAADRSSPPPLAFADSARESPGDQSPVSACRGSLNNAGKLSRGPRFLARKILRPAAALFGGGVNARRCLLDMSGWTLAALRLKEPGGGRHSIPR